MASKFTVPYAPSSVYRANNSIAELMLRAGAVNAEGARRSGEIWGSTIANLGQQVGGAVAQYQQEKQAKRAEEEMAKQDAAFVGLLSKSDGIPDPRAVISIYGPKRGMEVAKGLAAFGELGQKRGEEALKSLPTVIRGAQALSEPLRAKMYPILRERAVATGLFPPEAIPEQYDPETWGQMVQFGQSLEAQKPEAGFTLSPGQVRYDASGKEIAAGPVEPPKPPTSIDAAIVAADQKGDVAEVKRLMALKAQAEAVGRKPDAPKDERIVQIMGPQGTPIWVKESEAVGKPAAQAPRAVTGAERTALGFFNRAKQAVSDIAPIEEKVANSGLMRQAQLGYSGPGENLIKTQEQQAYRQAQRAFTEARLRKESGAAIPPAEYENDARTYFAQPGDTPATIEQKRRAREVVLGGLSYSAGRAYDEYYGEPAPKTPPSEVAKAVQVTAPNGKTYNFKNKAEADAFKKRAGIP